MRVMVTLAQKRVPSLRSRQPASSNLPVLVAGGKGGRHIRYAEPTPLANLHLTLLDRVGVRMDRFADSQGKVTELL